MFYVVFVFSAAFTVFVVLTVCLSVICFVYNFIINKLGGGSNQEVVDRRVENRLDAQFNTKCKP